MNEQRARETVVVVGGGIGGLAAAALVARSGRPVVLLEAQENLGGKLRREPVGGAWIDAGPTVLTMRWVLDEIFSACGQTFDSFVSLQRASVLARHSWEGGATLDLFDDLAASEDAIGRFAGAADARGFRDFARYAEGLFGIVEKPFLRSQKPTPTSVVRDARALGLGLGAFARIDASRSMMRALADFFRDPRLCQLFGRYATYVGSSPYAAPATLHLIAHVERMGVHYVDGGMHAIAAATAQLAKLLGVEIRTGARVSSIEVRGGAARAVVLEGGERIEAGAIVVNADAASLAARVFGAEVARAVSPVAPGDRSLSAMTYAVRGSLGAAAIRHNVYFARDYAAEMGDLFKRRALAAEPTVYVCAQDRDDRPSANRDERMLVIVNAPARGDEGLPNDEEIRRCETAMLATLERCGAPMTIHERVVTTPRDFARMFPGSGGAIYGRAQHGMFSAFSRPGARTKIAGLYLAGGSAHPGPGVPMAALSGSLAAQAIEDDWRSTARSRSAVTAGSISTA